MIPTTLAPVLTLASFLLICTLAALVGFLACVLLRLPWGVSVAATDVILAIIVTIVAGLVAAVIDTAHGVLESRLTLVLLIANAAVAIRHILRFALHGR